MNRLLVIWLLALALIAPVPAFAQSGLRFQTDPDAPLTLAAKTMRWQQAQGVSDLRGNVRVTQGPMRLRANEMQIRFAADGAAETLTARGDVELVNEDGQRATAETADFDIQKDRLVLRGTVVMQARGGDGRTQSQKLSGETLSIDMASGRARLRGGKSRARIELER